jgi:hypothetical protein
MCACVCVVLCCVSQVVPVCARACVCVRACVRVTHARVSTFFIDSQVIVLCSIMFSCAVWR